MKFCLGYLCHCLTFVGVVTLSGLSFSMHHYFAPVLYILSDMFLMIGQIDVKCFAKCFYEFFDKF